VLEAMEKDSGIRLEQLRADGGMVANNLLMQFQADILGRPVQSAAVHETTALGAAVAAGLAVGVFASLQEAAAVGRSGRRWEPRMPAPQREQLYRMWRRAVERSFGWAEELPPVGRPATPTA
jgi:glycerol kinase